MQRRGVISPTLAAWGRPAGRPANMLVNTTGNTHSEAARLARARRPQYGRPIPGVNGKLLSASLRFSLEERDDAAVSPANGRKTACLTTTLRS